MLTAMITLAILILALSAFFLAIDHLRVERIVRTELENGKLRARVESLERRVAELESYSR